VWSCLSIVIKEWTSSDTCSNVCVVHVYDMRGQSVYLTLGLMNAIDYIRRHKSEVTFCVTPLEIITYKCTYLCKKLLKTAWRKYPQLPGCPLIRSPPYPFSPPTRLFAPTRLPLIRSSSHPPTPSPGHPPAPHPLAPSPSRSPRHPLARPVTLSLAHSYMK